MTFDETVVRVLHPLEPVEIVVHSGPRGPAGEPGTGIQIRGVAESWPPDASPDRGDLWIIPRVPPQGTPPEFLPGDGAAWDGAAWVDTGPIKGADGPPAVVVDRVPPQPPEFDGFLWVNPSGPSPSLSYFEGDAWRPIPTVGPQGPPGQSVEVFGPQVSEPTPIRRGDVWLYSGPVMLATADGANTKRMPPSEPPKVKYLPADEPFRVVLK